MAIVEEKAETFWNGQEWGSTFRKMGPVVSSSHVSKGEGEGGGVILERCKQR